MYAHDDMGTTARPLEALASGSGWGGAWVVQNKKPGYAVNDLNPLLYGNLLGTPVYAVGGDSSNRSGRLLAAANFGPVKLASGNAIGEPGQELWISLLARRDHASSNWQLATHRDGTVWNGGNPRFAIQSISNQWALVALGNAAGAVSTGLTATVGQTFLLVLHVQFGDPDTLTLYVNPADLGQDPPDTAQAILSVTAADLSFNRVTWFPGSQVNQGSMDEVRFGSSFADVTPVDPNPNSLPQVSIEVPTEAATYVQGQTITFRASATDAEEGEIGEAIIWSSDLEGVLGAGAELPVPIANLRAGQHLITAQASDSRGGTGRQRVSVTILENTAIRILTATLPPATVGEPYTFTLEAFGGAPPYTWDAIGSTLPAGFQIDNAGRLQGQSETIGSQDIDFRVTDSLGAFTTQLLTLTVNPPPSTGPVLSTSILPPVRLGEPYDFTVVADATAVIYQVRNGMLTNGLQLDSATGRLHGTVPVSATDRILSFEIWVGNAQFDPQKPSWDKVNNTYRSMRLFGLRLIDPTQSPRWVRVFLAAGQSNMGNNAAAGAAQGTIYEAPLNDVWFAPVLYSGTGNRHVADWIAMGTNPFSTGAGCELPFSRLLADAFPEDQIAVIKSAVGATRITFWLPGEGGFISLQEAINLARQRLDSQVISGEIAGYTFEGLIWMQGEAESDVEPVYGANAYYQNLTNLVTGLEAVTRQIPLHTVLGRIDAKLDPALGGPPGVDVQSLEIVRTAQVSWADDRTWADWVSTDDLGHVDAWHFNGSGLITLGERMAAAMIPILPESLPFAQWQAGQPWNGKPSDFASDADQDGIPNGFEYWIGSDARIPNRWPAFILNTRILDGRPHLSYSLDKARRRTGVRVDFLTSTTLHPDSWTPAAAGLQQSAVDPISGQETLILTMPLESASLFLKIALQQDN